MEDTEHPSVEKASHTRTSQACQRCRSLKTRCLPSEQVGTCQRCSTSKRECVWPETQRRTKRLRGPSRISQVEQKIDGLVASLVSPDATRTDPSPPEAPARPGNASLPHASIIRSHAPGSWLPVPTSFIEETSNSGHGVDGDHRFLERLRQIHSFGNEHDLTRPPGTLFQSASHREPIIEHEIVKNLVASGKAEVLLNEYHSMSRSFPFVPVPSSTTIQEISVSKPMLFLSVLTIASWKDHRLQLSLDEVYRKELAHRTIIKPRRTLSLVQSLIVYLSWYQFVFSHKTQQIFSLMQVAIGIALEIGLHQKSKRPFVDMPRRPMPPPLSPQEERANQRAFLGCYYLSSSVAGGLQKPNLLKYTDYMAECGHRLKHDCEFSSDEVLLHLVSLRRIDDQIYDAFYSDETYTLPITDSRILMNLRCMETHMDEWKREKKSDEAERMLSLSFAYTQIQLQSVRLRPAHSSHEPTLASPTQLRALLSTLEAGKCFLDTLLAFPADEYHFISFPEWMRLPYVIIAISKLCIPSDAHTTSQWDVKTAQERIRLELCLESLCYRMQSLSTYEKPKQPHPDFWWAMRMILELTKDWYTRKIRPTRAAMSNVGDLPTPETLRNFHPASTEHSDPSHAPSIDGTNDTSYHPTGPADHSSIESQHPHQYDPFAFMRDADFDMDQFLDMGIWGTEGYEGMGFGGGSMGF